MFKDQIIFFAALDWGLGHATRSLPLLQKLVNENTVILGVSPAQKDFYRLNFPALEQVDLPSYRVTYSSFLPAWFKVLSQWPLLRQAIKREERILRTFISQKKVTVVVSDGRLGLHDPRIKSILITHQLKLTVPFFSGAVNRFYKNLLSVYSEIWVPDFEEPEKRLSGELSVNPLLKVPVRFIGPQSALAMEKKDPDHQKIDILIMLSGPEPQRSILEKLLCSQFADTGLKIFLVRGSTAKSRLKAGTIEVVDLASAKQLSGLMHHAEKIICRSGYSSLMDLYLLNKKNVVLIPTPGQPEQEYLARYWEKKFGAEIRSQNKISGTN